MSATVRILIAQLNLLVGATAQNADRIIEIVERARNEALADAVVFPELALSGYPPEDLVLRDSFLQENKRQLERIRAASKGITVIVGYPRKHNEQIYNAAAILRDGAHIASYHKQILPNYSVFDEKRHFSSGTKPCVVEIAGFPFGITICEDLWFPESALQAKNAGAKALININASPFHIGKVAQRESVLMQRISETGVPIVYLNIIGGQDELVFDGESLVINDEGQITQRLPAFEEAVETVEFSLDETGLHPQPAGLMEPLELEASVYKALVLGVRDYVHKNGFHGAVLGLSGGVDSALTLAIAVDALGAKAITAVMMPSRYSADMSLEDARQETEILRVAYHVVPIEAAFTAFLDLLHEPFNGAGQDVTEETLQARIRGTLLMAISNKQGRIVLTTGNKSEMAVGYTTLYGDMAGGFAPLKDVSKTLVYRLARYRNKCSHVIPERVLTRPPSAELRPDQTDQDLLPPYDVLDEILEAFVEEERSLDALIAGGVDEPTVRRIAGMILHNEYKRRQAPPGVRVTRRAFGRDRRYPITSGYTP